jgi:hypothetical protein
VQHRQQKQIDAKRAAIEQDEAQERRCDNSIQPERQAGDNRLAQVVESLDRTFET